MVSKPPLVSPADGQREVALSLPAPSSQAERDVFRAALQETSHAFLVARGANAHAMIRLAMLWRAVNLLPRRVKAPAYLFELLGLMAYQLAARRTPGQQPPLNRCYQEFLNMVMAYKTLEVTMLAQNRRGRSPLPALQRRIASNVAWAARVPRVSVVV